MATYTATLHWTRGNQRFVDNRYSRGHVWRFDGGSEIAASSSPHVVPLPYSIEAAVDPEEAFVASLASCHMLWFLSLAAKAGHTVDSYTDEPVGLMGKNDAGKIAMLRVTLRPFVVFAGDATAPSAAALEALHHAAHAECYLANSVRCDVICEPRLSP